MITKLSIVFDSDSRRITLEGPFDDTISMLGLLEMAKLIIIESRAKTGSVRDSTPQTIETVRGSLVKNMF